MVLIDQLPLRVQGEEGGGGGGSTTTRDPERHVAGRVAYDRARLARLVLSRCSTPINYLRHCLGCLFSVDLR